MVNGRPNGYCLDSGLNSPGLSPGLANTAVCYTHFPHSDSLSTEEYKWVPVIVGANGKCEMARPAFFFVRLRLFESLDHKTKIKSSI